MHKERHVSLFRNGRSQAIRIPRDFELEGAEALIRKEGDKLIIEPISKKSLKELLSTLPMLDEDFPDIVDSIVEPEDIF
jgi:antitoxin VapB